MTEEKLTKTILAWLEKTGWEILAFDFPQSGTGVMLHPNVSDRSHKNSDTIIPDIIAVKNGNAVIFENKNRFAKSDFEKVALAKSGGLFDFALAKILKDISAENIFWGIGMPFSIRNRQKASECSDMVDFIVFVEDDGATTAMGKSEGVFS